jgi:RNA-directed DNA polymerase
MNKKDLLQKTVIDFISLNTPRKLYEHLYIGISYEDFLCLLRKPDYKTYKTPKKHGGSREINVPETRLMIVQKKLNSSLQMYYSLLRPEYVFGFVHSCDGKPNIVANAAIHTGKRYILNLDLRNFFPSISGKRVYLLFRSSLFDYTNRMAAIISLLVTYRGNLPVGAPTSPVVSNFVCLPMDMELNRHCKANGLVYSRYADDITVSSDEPFSRSDIAAIICIAQRHGFKINFDKFRLCSFRSQQSVTGLVVNEKINIDRRKLKRLRAAIHDLSMNGVFEAACHYYHTDHADQALLQRFIASLNGKIAFVRQIKGTQPTNIFVLNALKNNYGNENVNI